MKKTGQVTKGRGSIVKCREKWLKWEGCVKLLNKFG